MFRVTRFELLMRMIPWGRFDQAVEQHGADSYCKGFTTTKHLMAMTYAQLIDGEGLRAVQDGYAQHKRAQYHIGLDRICRSTLSDANAKRDAAPFEELARALMGQVGAGAGEHGRHMLNLLDSTTIRLVGRGFEWTNENATRDRGLKVHVLYQPGQQVPLLRSITAANVNDVCEGRQIELKANSTYVFDKAYCDYAWWHKICEAGARFVTRAKSNIALESESQRPIPRQQRRVILDDRIARFRHASNRGKHHNAYTGLIRRIEVARDNGEMLVLLTNDLTAPAIEIAQLYKQRWQIELFFKWIKQHLQVKQFLGRSENAVRIQLLVALITYLLLLLYRAVHMPAATLWNVLIVLRHGLMQRPEVEESIYMRRRRQERHIARIQRPLFT